MSTEQAFLDFKCPYCGELVSFPETSANSIQECFNCLDVLIVPSPGNGAGRRIPIPIAAPRLTLRRLAANDWKPLLNFSSNDDFVAHMHGLRGEGEEAILQWLEQDKLVKLTTPDHAFNLAIETKDKGQLAGLVSLRLSESGQAAVSMVLHPDFRGQAIARETMEAILGFCFDQLRLHRLYAWFNHRNARACHLFEKAGFRREGVFLQNEFVNGEWQDTAFYAMLREEFSRRGKTVEP